MLVLEEQPSYSVKVTPKFLKSEYLRIFIEELRKGETMKITKIYMHALSWMIIVMLMIPPVIMAQDSEQTAQPPKFTHSQ